MRKARMLVTGGSGFLGSLLCRRGVEQGYEVWGTYVSNRPPEIEGVHPLRLDLQDDRAILEAVEISAPEVVIHTAYKKNDDQVMCRGTSRLAESCGNLERPPFFIFISTDFVFDGKKGHYTEQDTPGPVLEYGRQKLEGEIAVRKFLPEALVVRTSLLYDLDRIPAHLDFVFAALEKNGKCSIFQDEFRSPVVVGELAEALLKLAGMRYSGLLHIAGADRVDRYWLGLEMLRLFGFSTAGVSAGALDGSGIIRPPDTSLDSSRAEKLLGMRFSGAKEVLREVKI